MTLFDIEHRRQNQLRNLLDKVWTGDLTSPRNNSTTHNTFVNLIHGGFEKPAVEGWTIHCQIDSISSFRPFYMTEINQTRARQFPAYHPEFEIGLYQNSSENNPAPSIHFQIRPEKRISELRLGKVASTLNLLLGHDHLVDSSELKTHVEEFGESGEKQVWHVYWLVPDKETFCQINAGRKLKPATTGHQIEFLGRTTVTDQSFRPEENQNLPHNIDEFKDAADQANSTLMLGKVLNDLQLGLISIRDEEGRPLNLTARKHFREILTQIENISRQQDYLNNEIDYPSLIDLLKNSGLSESELILISRKITQLFNPDDEVS